MRPVDNTLFTSSTTVKTCVIVYNKIVLTQYSSNVIVLCVCGAALIDLCD